MIRFWRAWQTGGMGHGHLPQAGGMGDQSAVMMDALSIMSAAEAELKKS